LKVLNLGAIHIYLLIRNEALLSDVLVTLKISFKQSQLRLVGFQLTLRLLQVGLKRARIDDKEQVAFLHFLPFGKVDFHYSSIHLWLHIHRFGRGQSPEFMQLNGHIHSLHIGYQDILRRRRPVGNLLLTATHHWQEEKKDQRVNPWHRDWLGMAVGRFSLLLFASSTLRFVRYTRHSATIGWL
jgi:hypothetical protein